MIEKFIKKALYELSKDEFETAFLLLCPAIDKTAKKRYPRKKPGQRIKAFLNDELNSIIKLETRKGPLFKTGGNICLGGMSVDTVLYKLVRNGLVHDAEWPTDVQISHDNRGSMSFGFNNGVYQVPSGYIRMLPYVLVGAKENEDLDFGCPVNISYGNSLYNLNDFWGNLEKLIKL